MSWGRIGVAALACLGVLIFYIGVATLLAQGADGFVHACMAGCRLPTSTIEVMGALAAPTAILAIVYATWRGQESEKRRTVEFQGNANNLLIQELLRVAWNADDLIARQNEIARLAASGNFRIFPLMKRTILPNIGDRIVDLDAVTVSAVLRYEERLNISIELFEEDARRDKVDVDLVLFNLREILHVAICYIARLEGACEHQDVVKNEIRARVRALEP